MILPFFFMNGTAWNWVIVQEYISLVEAQDVKAEAERACQLGHPKYLLIFNYGIGIKTGIHFQLWN